MSVPMRWTSSLLLFFLLANSPVWAQDSCPMTLGDAIAKALSGKSLLEDNAETALAVAPAQQMEAPSQAGGGSLVNLPGFASLLGLAQEQGLIDRKDGITTISLTPFSFLSLLQPQFSSNQQLYENVGALRHWGGQIAFGGKGDSFDRDRDGTVDEALVAEDPNDIVTWEVKYQFGTRDRRDKANYEEYFGAVKDTVDDNFENFSAVSVALAAVLEGKVKDEKGCYSLSDLQAALESPRVAATVAELKASDEEVRKKAEAVFEKVDKKPIFTLVYGGTERKDKFGVDKRSAAVRGAFTRIGKIDLGGTNAVELSWSEVESLLGVDDAVTWKLGYNYSRSFLKGSALSKDGLTLAVAGTYEMLRDVPMATHDTISKLNAKFSIPVTEGMEIPISVTWANHKDLLTEEEDIQGHIGFTVDYSKIRDQILGKK